VPQRWVLVGELGGHRAVVEARHLVGNDQRDRAADRGEVAELGGAVSGQAHHRHGAGPQQPEQRDREMT
jgi:hypothetical protein